MNSIKVLKRNSAGTNSIHTSAPISVVAVFPTVNEKLQKKLNIIMISGKNCFAVQFTSWNSQTNNRTNLLNALTNMLKPTIYKPKDWDDGLVELHLGKNCGASGLGVHEDWVGTTKFSCYVRGDKKNTIVEGVLDYAPDRINKLPSAISYKVTGLTAAAAVVKARSKAKLLPRDLSRTEEDGWKKLQSGKTVLLEQSNTYRSFYYNREVFTALGDFLSKNHFGTDGKELRFSMTREHTCDSQNDAVTGMRTSAEHFFVEISRVYNAKTHTQRGEFRSTLQQLPSAIRYNNSWQTTVEWIPE